LKEGGPNFSLLLGNLLANVGIAYVFLLVLVTVAAFTAVKKVNANQNQDQNNVKQVKKDKGPTPSKGPLRGR